MKRDGMRRFMYRAGMREERLEALHRERETVRRLNVSLGHGGYCRAKHVSLFELEEVRGE